MENQPRIQWYHSPLDKETLRKLTIRSDLRAFAQILSQLMLAAICGTGAYFAFQKLPLWLGILVFYIYATVLSFLGYGAAGHELSHRTAFRTQFWNEFFIIIISFLSWKNFIHYRASHMRHHQYTVHKGLDLEVVLPLKISGLDWLFLFTFNGGRFVNEFTTLVRHCFGIVKGEQEEQIFPVTDKKGRRQLFMWARIFILGHLALAALFIVTGQWTLLLLATFATYFANWLNLLVGFPQHAGLQPDVDDFRLSCRTVKLNPVFSYLYWQMNYHLEHHMYAGVPFYNLKDLRKAIETDLPPAAPNLASAWKEILSTLREQKSNPAYFHVPALPDRNVQVK